MNDDLWGAWIVLGLPYAAPILMLAAFFPSVTEAQSNPARVAGSRAAHSAIAGSYFSDAPLDPVAAQSKRDMLNARLDLARKGNIVSAMRDKPDRMLYDEKLSRYAFADKATKEAEIKRLEDEVGRLDEAIAEAKAKEAKAAKQAAKKPKKPKKARG